MLPASVPPETIHPSLWRAGQLARGATRCVDTGHPALSAELPGGGWPVGALTDLLLQQPGIGELRLLAPVFRAAGRRPVALVQPPHLPNPVAFAYWGIPVDVFLWLRPQSTADVLWSTEQVLKADVCSAVVLWQTSVRAESLRRLHVVAQGSKSLFFVIRPLYAARDASPAPLRLGLRPYADGILVDILKRQGPQREEPLELALSPSPVLLSGHTQAHKGRELRPASAPDSAKILALTR